MADRMSKAKAWHGDAARAAVYWQGGDPRWQTGDIVPLTTTERAASGPNMGTRYSVRVRVASMHA